MRTSLSRGAGLVAVLPPALMGASWWVWAGGRWPDWLAACWRQACAQAPHRALAFDALGAMPLCARCTGMWSGALLGAVAASLTESIAATRVPRRWWWAFAGFALAFGDGLASVLGAWDAPALERVLSGVLLGGCGTYLASSVAQTVAFHHVALGRHGKEG